MRPAHGARGARCQPAQETAEPEVRSGRIRKLSIQQAPRRSSSEGLRKVAGPEGTAGRRRSRASRCPVAGKTGTAEFRPSSPSPGSPGTHRPTSRRYVVVAMIEEGGGGSLQRGADRAPDLRGAAGPAGDRDHPRRGDRLMAARLDGGGRRTDDRHRAPRPRGGRSRSGWARTPRPRHLDPLLMLAVLGLTGLRHGDDLLGDVLPAGAAGSDTLFYVNRQMISLGIGMVGMAADRAVRLPRLPGLVAGRCTRVTLCCLLVLVAGRGHQRRPRRGWCIGAFQFQPSELAKVGADRHAGGAVPRAAGGGPGPARAARGAGDRRLADGADPAAARLRHVPGVRRDRVRRAAAGPRARPLHGGAVAVWASRRSSPMLQSDIARGLPGGAPHVVHQPRGRGPARYVYNVNQAQIAIGSGQLVGQGLFEGTQTKLAYVPENQTDFIFTVVGEELGFLGSAVLLGAVRAAAVARRSGSPRCHATRSGP